MKQQHGKKNMVGSGINRRSRTRNEKMAVKNTKKIGDSTAMVGERKDRW